jgi:ribosomal protein S15P/S13E
MVKSIIGKKIVKILKENGLAPTIPEDLEVLLKKATQLRTHLEKYRSDKYSKRSIQTIESRIRSLSEYYKKKGLLEKNWRYTRSTIINI